jgi:hypothetical protein
VHRRGDTAGTVDLLANAGPEAGRRAATVLCQDLREGCVEIEREGHPNACGYLPQPVAIASVAKLHRCDPCGLSRTRVDDHHGLELSIVRAVVHDATLTVNARPYQISGN